MRITRLLPGLALLAGSLGHAATDVTEDELVRADFRVLPVLSAEWNGIFYRPAPGEPMVELEFRSLARSFNTYDYRGPQTLRFFRRDGTGAAGEPRYREIASVPVTASEMLVFFKPNRRTAPGAPEFSLLGIDDSPSALPSDHIAFVNFMPVPFACRFLDQDRVLRPGASEPISLRGKLEEDLFVGLVVQNENTHRVVLRNQWEFQPGNRHLILLLPPEKSDTYRIRAYRITDFVGEDPRFTGNRPTSVADSAN